MKETIKSILRPVITSIRKYEYRILGLIAPKTLASVLYKSCYHRKLNWENPTDIDEKINWLKFNTDTSRWIDLADKYKVRDYVKECGLSHMLVKLYGKWDSVDAIDWDVLPQQFVMKTNNGSGNILICRDKEKLDKKAWVDKFKKMLSQGFGLDQAELHYNKIKPCVIAEELLDNSKQDIESSSLIDYKIWAFNGKPEYIWVCYNRTSHSCFVKVYDLDWQAHPEYSVDCEHYQLSEIDIPRPKSFESMLEAAAKLSKGFSVVRVDLYEVDGKAYFGEMTFTPAAGYNYFYTDDFLKILGEKANIEI